MRRGPWNLREFKLRLPVVVQAIIVIARHREPRFFKVRVEAECGFGCFFCGRETLRRMVIAVAVDEKVDVVPETICESEVRVLLNRLSYKLRDLIPGRLRIRTGTTIKAGAGTEIKIISREVLGRLLPDCGLFTSGERGLELADDCLGQLALQREDVFHLPIVMFRPDLSIAGCV